VFGRIVADEPSVTDGDPCHRYGQRGGHRFALRVMSGRATAACVTTSETVMSAPRFSASGPATLILATLLVSPPATGQGGIGTVGAELDEANGYLVFGGLGGEWSNTTWWDFSASRSDTTTTLTNYRTTAVAGSVYHDFGAFGVRVGLGGWRDEALSRVERLSSSIDWHGPAWSLTLQGQLKRSDFDPLAVDRVVERRDGTTVAITGTVDCAVDDVGLGARLDYTGGAWSFALSGMQYDYDNFSCAFDIAALDLLRDSTRAEFVQIADRVTDVLAIGAARRLLAETSFLDNRLGLSLRHEAATRAYSVYYDRVEDAFFRRSADTLSAGITFPIGSTTELEVYAGLTDSNVSDYIAFVGLMLLIQR
jgi:hypothetical protein